jgi:RNA polymerase-associated protein CTR9
LERIPLFLLLITIWTPPLIRSDEVVAIKLDELPDDANDILDILRAEMAPLSLWLRFAVEYYKQGKLRKLLPRVTLAL